MFLTSRFKSLGHRRQTKGINRPDQRIKHRFRPRLESLERRVVPCTINWTGNGDGVSWRDPANWDLNQMPAAADDACIATGANMAVVHSQGTDAINSLTSDTPVVLSGGSLSLAATSSVTNTVRLSSGSLGGAGDLRIEGTLVWTGGTMDGTGTTTVVDGVRMSGSGVTLGRTLLNVSFATMEGASSSLNITGTGNFTNLDFSTFEFLNDGSVGGVGRFINQAQATIWKLAGTGVSLIQNQFSDFGTTFVQSGTLRLTTSGVGGTYSGLIRALPAATIDFAGGTETFTSDAHIIGGNVVFSGGTAMFTGTYDVSQSTTFSGANVTFTPDAAVNAMGNTVSVTSGTINCNSPQTITTVYLYLAGGALTGSENIDNTNVFFWSGGTLSGSGTTEVTSEVLIDGGSVTLGRTLNDALFGQITGASASLTLSPGAVFNNQPGAFFALRSGGGISGTGTFNNQPNALFVRLFDTGMANIQAVFNNRGEVDISSGTLNFSGGGNDPGTFAGLAGTTLQFSGGSHQLQSSSAIIVPNVVFSGGSVTVDGAYTASNSTTFNGASVVFSAAATLSDLGPTVTMSSGNVMLNAQPATLTMANLNLLGGTLQGSENLSLRTVTWSGGFLGGGGAATVFDLIEVIGNVTLGRSLTIAETGTAQILGPQSSLNMQTGVSLTAAFFVIAGNSSGISGSGAFTVTDTLGLFGTSTIQGTFNNAGSVVINDGILHLTGGGNESGSFSTGFAGGLDFASGTYDFQSSANITLPNISFSGGTVNLNGTFVVSGSSTFSGATVTFNPGMNVMAVGSLSIISGLVTFSSGQAINAIGFFFSGGRLTGTDNITISDAFTWQGGTMDGTGMTTANNGIDLTGSNLTLGRTLTNTSVAGWTGGDINATASGVFHNGVGATFLLLNDQSFTSPSCLGTFTNDGDFIKKQSYGTSTMGLFFNNNGNEVIQTGIVNFPCGMGRPSPGRGLRSNPDADERGLGIDLDRVLSIERVDLAMLISPPPNSEVAEIPVVLNTAESTSLAPLHSPIVRMTPRNVAKLPVPRHNIEDVTDMDPV